MLIKALCDYYDVLEEQGKILDRAYSEVKIKYIINITEDGKIDGITDCTETVSNGKSSRSLAKTMILPKRIEYTGVKAHVIDHRPAYIFGLTRDSDGKLTTEFENDKTKKSHMSFVKTNGDFFGGIDEPICRAFYRFVTEWVPGNETENEHLKKLGKDFNGATFAFCLSGRPDIMLHENEEVKRHWKEEYRRIMDEAAKSAEHRFCSVTGQMAPISKKHDSIQNTGGGKSYPKLVSRNNSAEYSYGQGDSAGSGISDDAMNRYTKALSYLMSDRLHRTDMGSIIVIHWAASGNELCDMAFNNRSGINSAGNDTGTAEENENVEEVNDAVSKAIKSAAAGVQSIDTDALIDSLEDETFYIVGFKVNQARIFVQFFYEDSFGKIIKNVKAHQDDMRTANIKRPVSIWSIKRQIAPLSQNGKDDKKSKDDDKINPRTYEGLMRSIITGAAYPSTIYRTVLGNIQSERSKSSDSDAAAAQTDKAKGSGGGSRLNNVSIGILKGYINRYNRKRGIKEEITVSLNKENVSPPYLCGRLFATLENIQRYASDGELNRSIRDMYFNKTSKYPGKYLPKLIALSNHHISKKGMARAEAERNSILAMFGADGNYSFPQRLSSVEQGEFIIGYAQQKEENIRIAVEMKQQKAAEQADKTADAATDTQEGM